MQHFGAYFLGVFLTLVMTPTSHARELPQPLPDLTTIRTEFVSWAQATDTWPQIMAELIASAKQLRQPTATTALSSAEKHINAMRAITAAGIAEDELESLAQFKYSQVRLYLNLARSSCSRALTAILADADASTLLAPKLTELIAAIDQLIPAELDSDSKADPT